MNTRTALALLLAAGTCAHAQNVCRVTYSWREVVVGTTTPVAAPNSILDPGEGAYIRLNVTAEVNGSNAIGQTITYSNGPTPGFGTVGGFGGIVYSIAGTGADAAGLWNSRAMNSVLSVASDIGHIGSRGARVNNFGGAQFPAFGAVANPTNPINSVWRGVWNPSDYSTRVVHFQAEAGNAVPIGQQNAMDIHYRTDFIDPLDPSTAYPVYWTVYFLSDFGSGIDIPIDIGVWSGQSCYVNCDDSTGGPVLNILDFQCFMNAFSLGQSYANCDHSTAPPVLSANDFQCFLTLFAMGCS